MNLNIDINNQIGQTYEQYFLNTKRSIWTKTWSIMLNRNVNLKTIMDKQFEDKYEHSICTNIWTINFNRSVNLNSFINNQFERNYQELIKKKHNQLEQIYQQSIWTKNEQPFWTKTWTRILNRKLINQFD